ncbi:uncharacterized protein LOC144864980 [Branchiostoma floridae x Branchiostoma japonicum]
MEEYIEAGSKLGLKEEALQTYVQQALEREERAKEREMQKLKLEAEEREKERQVEMEKLKLEAEKLKLEAEEKEKERQAEMEKLKLEAEKLKLEAEEKEKERQVEIEKLKLQAEEKERERQEKEAERRHQLEMKQLGPEGGAAAESESVRAKIPKLPAFEDGKDDLDAFLQRFERFATSNGWKETTWASTLSALLNGTALQVYSRLSDYEARDYNKVKEALMKRYNLTEDGFRAKFRHNQPEKGESPEQFLVRLTKYLDRWVDLSKTTRDYESLRDLFVREQFMEACPRDLATHLRERAPQSMTEMAEMAQHFLEAHKRELATRVDTVEFKNQRDVRFVKRCYTCNSAEHLARSCPHAKQESSPPPRTSLYGGEGAEVMKFECTGQVEGKPVTMLLDTGSTQTLVHETLVDAAKIMPDARGGITCIHGDVRHYPTASITIKVGRSTYAVRAKVSPNLPRPVILGRDIPNLAKLVHTCTTGAQETFVTTRAQAKRDETTETKLQAAMEQSEVRPHELNGLPSVLQQDPINDWRGFADDLFCGEGKSRKTKRQRRAEKRRGTPDRDQPATGERNPLDARKLTAEDIRRLQWEDPTLSKIRELLNQEEGDKGGAVRVLYIQEGGMIYRRWSPGTEDEERKQLVLPQQCRQVVLQLAHDAPMAGHLGKKKTTERILMNFFWPGVHSDVKAHCRGCEVCQKTARRSATNRAPLIPLPIMDIPFQRIAMDIVGPLERSKTGNKYVLVVCDYATRYPEAIPMRSVDAKHVAGELIKMFARVGIPEEILTDQGTNFMSKLLTELYDALKIRGIRTSPYHPQTDGLVERFNGTLKSMLKKVSKEDPRDWDSLLPYLLFAYREVPQESTGFSPFELLYGHPVRGPLKVVRECWEANDKSSESVVSYVLRVRERLASMTTLVRENLETAQRKQKTWYDRKARTRQFDVGDEVLVLLPSSNVKMEAEWQGPYTVTRKVGSVDYEIATPGKKKKSQILHVNLLKRWYSPNQPCLAVFENETDATEWEDGQEVSHLLGEKDINPFGWKEAIIDEGLEPGQRREIEDLLQEFSDVLQDRPGRTTLTQHHIDTGDARPVRQRPYRVAQAHRETMRTELQKMEQMGVIEPSNSDWASPVVLVPKKDGSVRFCVDFRKVNAISRFDAYPIPRIDEMLDKLGKAKYITKMDLSRGYWQVPLTEESKRKTAFVTAFGLYQFHTMPFGLHGAAATFQRLMDRVLRGTEEFADGYIDDLDVFSEGWKDHLSHLREVLTRLREAGLTAKPKKCHIAMTRMPLLGHVVGGGQIRPDEEKVRAVKEFPRPETKSDVRTFLGLTGYYRRFVPGYATIATPLTDLTKKRQPQAVLWSEECERAFQVLKSHLCQEPVLKSPNFEETFILQTDASESGIGAVLTQISGNDEEHPVVYVSRKLLPRERNYSVPEKECLAIKYAVETLHYYLIGRKFVIMTDHHPLQWLDQMQHRNQRLTRWSLCLQPYQFEVQHRPGRLHANADALSRG